MSMENKIIYLKKKINILPINRAKEIRELYINKFINIDSDYYMTNIKNRRPFSDGECYIGYLWDTLKVWEKVQFIDLQKCLPSGEQKVLVFWDIHSKEKILVENYWKFGKENIIEIGVNDLLDNLDLFPEDIYIFDQSFEWSIILTHETEGEDDWPVSRIVVKTIPN
jgi:hypothetical protein